MKKISIITVNYNQTQATADFLQSLDRTQAPYDELFVVDNASKPALSEGLKTDSPRIKWIRSETNLGFAGGNNLALREATGDYIFLVNNDTEFTEGLVQTLSELLDSNPQIGIVSPKILFFDQPETLQYAGFTEMNYYTMRNRCIGELEQDSGQYNGPAHPTGYIHGAAMMIRREALIKAGPMPELFFLYYEEMDWCERIKDAGFEVWIEPSASIFHKESMSVGKKSALKEYFMNRNRILFARRNSGFPALWIFWIYFLTIVLPKMTIRLAAEQRLVMFRQIVNAILWNFRFSAQTSSNNTGFKP